MKYEIMIRDSIDETKELDAILKLHKEVFGSSDNLVQKMRSKPNLLIMAAMDGEKVVGYKLGYELDQHTFYSWLGGIDADYRKRGIASRLMEKQHHYLKEKGYTVVQTKTMNKWRSMLVLNIKSGFDIIDVYTDEKGQRKIVLEKELTL